MDAAEWSPSGLGLLVVILVIPGTILLLYLLMQYWQRRARRDLQPLLQQLHNFRAERRQFYTETRGYSIQDREPYGSRMKGVTSRLSDIDQRLNSLRQQYEDLQDEVDRLSVNSVQSLVGAPFLWTDWYRVRHEISALRESLAEVSGDAEVLRESLRQIKNLPWEGALLARSLRDEDQELRRLLDGLAERKVHGRAFETAVRQEEQLRSRLRRIPAAFFTAEQPELLEQADKDGVSAVFETVEAIRPRLGQLMEQARGWEQLYQEALTKVNHTRQVVSEVDGLVSAMPAGLNLNPLVARLRPLSEIAASLFATLSRLEVESLPAMVEEAGRASESAKEMLNQLRQARRHQIALERVASELKASLKELSGQFAALAKNSTHPVVWNVSRDQFADLSRQAGAFDLAGSQRDLEQAAADLTRVNALLARQKELATHCQEIGRQHAGLLALLDGTDLKEGLAWTREAAEFTTKAAVYDPENWPRADAPAALGRDLREQMERHQRLVPTNPASPVQETELKGLVENLQALKSQYAALRARVDKVRSRYSEVLEVEKNARERLQAARTALGQIELLVGSIDFLKTLAGPEIDRLRSDLETAGAGLNARQRGVVEAKDRTVKELAARLENAANGWLERLNADIEAKKKSLSTMLDTLSEIAALDERAVTQAQDLIEQDIQATVVSRSRQKAAFIPLDELVAALKPRCDCWQSSVAAIRELGDIEKQVVEAHHNAAEHYQEAKEQLTVALQYAPERRSWPPTSLSLTAELQEYNQVEAQWDTLEREPNRALSAVRQLSDIAGKCQVLAERARQIAERAAQEQERIEDLEDQLAQLFRLWQDQAQAYPEAANQIRKLKLQTEGEVSDLRRQYTQGALSYHQVLQALSLIYRNLQGAQIRLEGGHVVSIDGRDRLSPRQP